nr:unnamed protein product [Digitaria exilis]
MLLLRRRLLPLFPAASTIPSPIHHETKQELGLTTTTLPTIPERVKEFVLRVEELGVRCSNSGKFRNAMRVVAGIKKERVALKLNFLTSTLGCSEKEVAIAVSKVPSILGLSEEKLVNKIQFLLNVVGLELQYIVDRPVLLAYDLEKRLVAVEEENKKKNR